MLQDSDPADPAQEGPPSRGPLIVALLLALAVVGGGVAWYAMRPAPAPPKPEAKAAPAPAPRRAAPTPKAEAPPPEPEPARPRTPRPRPAPAAPAPAETVAAPPAFSLRIESDVAGASVFVDRKYLGTAPITTSDIGPGSHQLNASADGFDGIVRTIDVADSGTTEVSLRFKEVKLDASVDVVHKHGMGSCEGRLAADVQGLRYETSNKGDAFRMSFAELEGFDVDYIQKNLRVKRKGGKTWNFTDKSGNADKLFVFHRDVSKAREKLGK